MSDFADDLPSTPETDHRLPSSRPLASWWGTRAGFELTRRSLFLRAGRWELYVAPDCAQVSQWFVLREPGSVELAAGMLRLTVARAPVRAAAMDLCDLQAG